MLPTFLPVSIRNLKYFLKCNSYGPYLEPHLPGIYWELSTINYKTRSKNDDSSWKESAVSSRQLPQREAIAMLTGNVGLILGGAITGHSEGSRCISIEKQGLCNSSFLTLHLVVIIYCTVIPYLTQIILVFMIYFILLSFLCNLQYSGTGKFKHLFLH